MRIAFTHNIQLTDGEDEAEFDRPETITAIAAALRKLGHEVEPLDVAGPASRLVARLEALAPDLVFNTAEGRQGRFREAFYPALFEKLGLPFTFSDAYVCALTLDKQLTKMIVSRQGVPTPKWVMIDNMDSMEDVRRAALNFPLIVKPNFEGSSMGISEDSIVENERDLRTRVQTMLARFPEGLLVEEFIEGDDLTVPFLERANPEYQGILEPAQYEYGAEIAARRRYNIYDYEMKITYHSAVTVRVPANISADQREAAFAFSQRAIRALGIRDAARIDFRIDRSGQLQFIEINALPSFEPGSSIYTSAALAGLGTMDGVMEAIVASTSERFGINLPRLGKSRQKRKRVRVGLTFNLRRVDSALENAMDQEAEFDSPDTIAAIKQALESFDHEVIELEATRELPSILPAAGVEVVFNIAEGLEGRTRESQVPALLELLGIPYTGSDPTTLSISHDKALAKRLVIQAGIKTPPFALMASGKERLPKDFSFPAIVKPVAEGSSKGIVRTSVVECEAELRAIIQEVTGKYRQAVLVEHYLPGREFTIAMLGEKRPRVLPPMEIIFVDKNPKYLVYTFENKFFNADKVRFEAPARISNQLKRDLERSARSIFSVLGCRDFARVDLRLDEAGNLNFIECNPLPGLAPGFSDFCVIAEAAGIKYNALIGDILAPALRRMRERQKERYLGANN